MKILTLNTHSIIEEQYENKLSSFVQMIHREQPEVFALQEVNQTVGKPLEKAPQKTGYIPCKGGRAVILQDNHALRTAQMLEKLGSPYKWTWIPLKIGYQRYEEGLAVFSKYPIEDTRQFFISKCREMSNWKTRKMLGIKVNGIWFYSVHMGWWDDEEERFADQWDVVCKELGRNKTDEKPCFVMGDFNCPAEIKNEGYDYVVSSVWSDTFTLAKKKDSGITVGKVIDGWRERMDENAKGMRIDYIWCDKEVDVTYSKVVFNGQEDPVVSDHYGVEIEVGL